MKVSFQTICSHKSFSALLHSWIDAIFVFFGSDLFLEWLRCSSWWFLPSFCLLDGSRVLTWVSRFLSDHGLCSAIDSLSAITDIWVCWIFLSQLVSDCFMSFSFSLNTAELVFRSSAVLSASSVKSCPKKVSSFPLLPSFLVLSTLFSSLFSWLALVLSQLVQLTLNHFPFPSVSSGWSVSVAAAPWLIPAASHQWSCQRILLLLFSSSKGSSGETCWLLKIAFPSHLLVSDIWIQEDAMRLTYNQLCLVHLECLSRHASHHQRPFALWRLFTWFPCQDNVHCSLSSLQDQTKKRN